jgi:hypothetical protein
MQTELTTTPHPHDPHADDLTWSQAVDVLHYFGAGPPPPRFTAIGSAVMLAGEQIATTRGSTMAKRIAHALNWYKPGRRGT